MLKDKEPRVALFCFAWNIFSMKIFHISFSYCYFWYVKVRGYGKERLRAGHGGDFCRGSQWCAEAMCTPLCKWCSLHLRAGFKRFYLARAENTAAGAGRGVGGLKQESSRIQGKETPRIWKYLSGMKLWNFSLFSAEDITRAISWALPSMSPLKRSP